VKGIDMTISNHRVLPPNSPSKRNPTIFNACCLSIWTILGIALFAGQILTRGEEVTPCSTVNVRAVQLDDGFVLMDQDGKVLTTERYCDGGEYSDGLILFVRCTPGGKKQFVYLNEEGKEVLEVSFALATGFSDGLAAVEDERYRWGYIDKLGKLVIPFQFDYANPFSEGLAGVDINRRIRYIDKSGRTILKPHVHGRDIFPGEFVSGSALIMSYDTHLHSDLDGFIDHSGEWIVKQGTNIYPSWSAGKGFFNSVGPVELDPKFSSLWEFQEGLAVASASSATAGFIDKRGQWALPPVYQDARHFCEDRAPVKLNDKWGYIDTRGTIVIPPTYEDAESFDGGIAKVYFRDDKNALRLQYIDRQGNVLYLTSGEIIYVEIIKPVQ
jgi:hypothetical protein